MDVIPAIDLRSGKCVRLLQGDYERQIDYEGDPVEIAQGFEKAGATWVHIVDLDGAHDGRMNNLDTIEAIAENTGLQIEVGGGIRHEATIAALEEVGVARVVIGTQALRDWAWFDQLVHKTEHHRRIALGLDAREGRLAVEGWTEQTDWSCIDVAKRVVDWPLGAIIYTDIARDGMLLGPNIEAMRKMAELSKVPVVASGGVTDISDVRKLGELPIVGMIVGRAIYEKQLDLAEAVRVAAES